MKVRCWDCGFYRVPPQISFLGDDPTSRPPLQGKCLRKNRTSIEKEAMMPRLCLCFVRRVSGEYERQVYDDKLHERWRTYLYIAAAGATIIGTMVAIIKFM
jgi:hypothetical protein